MMRTAKALLLAMSCFSGFEAAKAASFDLQTAILSIDSKGYARLEVKDAATPWPASAQPILQATGKDVQLVPESVTVEEDKLKANFPGGGVCEFSVFPANGFAVFDMVRCELPQNIDELRLFSLALPKGAEIQQTLNAGYTPTHTVAVSAAEPNVRAYNQNSGRHDVDRAGCTHTLTPADQARSGMGAMRFAATCDAKNAGWAMFGHDLRQPIDLTGLKAIRAWVKGDGKGEALKIQLYDGFGGYRDTYIPIDFSEWRQITLSESHVNTLRFDHVSTLNIYYNGMPAGQTVACDIDQIEAVLDRNGKEEVVLLEGFEPDSAFWLEPFITLNAETLSRHGLQPARFGIIAAPRETFMEAMQRFEEAAGMPSPKPGGVWNKQSPWIKRSYLFITSFYESQFDDVLALARRGGFDMILMGQESWTKSTGHYEVNTEHFPDGLEGLQRTFQRFRQEGFHAGLHFLGASIYPPDAYLTPVPDPRLVHGPSVPLAADIDQNTTTLLTESAPNAFPAEDGGYMGDGAIVQIDNELISYGVRKIDAPFGFEGCTRGLLGTVPALHAKGQPVRHLQRSYGYFMFDMDTTLIDEISSNFAKIANACDIDMIYFDGSERLQGDHWYYNPRLHKAYFDKLARKDILLQASSFSHYSWHILARSASADGHGDLKGYLDERSPAFDAFKRDGMPLDIGWYYGYDASCTPDMYEYILGASIGYDSSMSFQVSLDAASKHPFTGEILDLISRYEQLRLSGRVPAEMRDRLRINPQLGGTKEPEEREKLRHLRREYRLMKKDGNDAFQRVEYLPWHEITAQDPPSETWPVRIAEGPARIGVQLHVMPGPWLEAGTAYRAPEAITLESFDDLASYLRDRANRTGVKEITNGEAGATLAGVTQHITISEQDAKEGGRCALYSAESTLDTNGGWSVFGKTFDPPLDLSQHKALGFWMRGDGKGGAFKLQLLDGTKAADFYISNDYTGWRYQQLPRPETDPIDYNKVRTLNFYYNGLPAHTAVTCAIDDVKALPNVDQQALADPWIEIAGQRLNWPGTLTAGQYLFLWPEESPKVYGPAFHEPLTGQDNTPLFTVPEGEYSVHFGHSGSLTVSLRVRVTLQPPECHVF